MKRIALVFSLLFVLNMSPVLAQTMMDYVKSVRGDTLVVKDDNDFGKPSTLRNLLTADTINVPTGRVYMLRKNGYYSFVTPLTTSKKRKVIIMGEDRRSVKTNKDASSAPPVISGIANEGWTSAAGINSGFDCELKNLCFEATCPQNLQIAWVYLVANENTRMVLDNVLGEHTQWVMARPQKGASLFIKNSYLINAVGGYGRCNGGAVDIPAGVDTLWVENTTHVNGQGISYSFAEKSSIKRAVFNHNTWINCPGHVIMSVGSCANISFTNNILVNSHIYAMPVGLKTYDEGQKDRDELPMGIINVYPSDTNFVNMGAKYYVDKNLVYWSPAFDDYVSLLKTAKVNGVENWVNCMITMNSRTQAAFDHSTKYPLLTERTWVKNTLPTFKNTASLLSPTTIASIKAFALKTVDTTSTVMLPMWREVNKDLSAYWTLCDWPTPIDLSYTDAPLLTGGLSKFPLGDLDWFPTQKTYWLTQRTKEYSNIAAVLNGWVDGVEQVTDLPSGYILGQNYPNPFNPTTTISYQIPKAGFVSLKIYDLLGKECAVLVSEEKAADHYEVKYKASSLSSGVYYYELRCGQHSQIKKMVLLK